MAAAAAEVAAAASVAQLPAERHRQATIATAAASPSAQQPSAIRRSATPAGTGHKPSPADRRRRASGSKARRAARPAATPQASAALPLPLASFSRKRQLDTDHGGEEEKGEVVAAAGRRHSVQPSKLARQPQPASRAESLFDSLFLGDQQGQHKEEGVGEQEVGQEVAKVQQQQQRHQQEVGSRQPCSATQVQAGGGAEGDADLAAAVQRRLEQHKTRMLALAAAQSHRRRSTQPLGA